MSRQGLPPSFALDRQRRDLARPALDPFHRTLVARDPAIDPRPAFRRINSTPSGRATIGTSEPRKARIVGSSRWIVDLKAGSPTAAVSQNSKKPAGKLGADGGNRTPTSSLEPSLGRRAASATTN